MGGHNLSFLVIRYFQRSMNMWPHILLLHHGNMLHVLYNQNQPMNKYIHVFVFPSCWKTILWHNYTVLLFLCVMRWYEMPMFFEPAFVGFHVFFSGLEVLKYQWVHRSFVLLALVDSTMRRLSGKFWCLHGLPVQWNVRGLFSWLTWVLLPFPEFVKFNSKDIVGFNELLLLMVRKSQTTIWDV